MRRRTTARLAGLACALAAATGCKAIDILVPDGPVLSDAQQAIVDSRLPPSDLKVFVTPDHRDLSYRHGEPVRLTVAVSKDAHVAVLRVLRSGATTVVFPNRLQRDTIVRAGSRLAIPGDGVTIASGPAGNEVFEVVANTQGGSWLFKRVPAGSDLYVDLGSATRPLAKDILGSMKAGESATARVIVSVE